MPSIALLDGPADSPETKAVSIEVTWESWVKALHTAKFTECNPCPGKDCPHKAGRAWLPVRLIESPCQRLDANVAALTFAVFDLDEPTDEQMRRLAQSLEGFAYLVHQTHRGNGYRLVLPLTEEVPAAMWRDVWAKIGARFNIPCDVTCINESRLYYTPTRPAGSEYRIYDGLGEPLNWKALDPVFPSGAASAIAVFDAAAKAGAAATVNAEDPANLREGPLDLEELRRAVGSMRRPESRQLLDTILSGRKLAEIGFRDTAVQKAVSLLATAPLGKPYPADAVVALLTGSIRAMDCEPEGLEHWLLEARRKYIRAAGRRLENDAKSDADKAVLLQILGQEGPQGPAEEWRKGLLYTLTPGGEPGGLRPIGANANLILANDSNFKGYLRFNEITREIDVLGGFLAGKPKATLDTEAANWFARSEYRLFMSSRDVGEQILAIARQQSYDPLREWVEGLKWDGVDRVPDFFTSYFGAEGDPRHLQAISRCFLISCVARAMRPGCEVHTVPILIGAQGVGKSRACKALGTPYFTDSGLTIGDKDSRMLIASRWIVELAELASVKNTDVEKVKSFVSLASDDFRPPYGRVTESFLRRCVFIGTTNEEEVLTDWTGNRRWWPIKVSRGDVDRIAADRDQLFAQALVMYRAGAQWHLTDAEARVAAFQAEGFRRCSARAEQILAWFAARQPSDRPSELTTFDLLNTVLGVPSAQISVGQTMEVGRAARELGFTKHRKRQGGQLVWVYRTPAEILGMKKDEKPLAVELVQIPRTGDDK